MHLSPAKSIIAVLLTLAATAMPAFANGFIISKDTTTVKKGWTWSAVPMLAYSSTMGIQLGAQGHAYFHGDGSHYPQPVHDIGAKFSWYSHGNMYANLSYDSKFLIPGVRLSVAATYTNEPMFHFYGYNGAAQLYYKSMGASLYGMNRSSAKFTSSFQGTIWKDFSWAAGFTYWWMKTSALNGRFAEKFCPDGDNTIYTSYVDYGLIGAKEAKGGNHIEFRAGVVYDSRDKEAAPEKGIWAELYAFGAPDMFKTGFNYLKLAFHFRHFVSLPWKWKGGGMVFAYHLGYQGTVAGETPFYMQQNICNLMQRQVMSEGLGSTSTVRAIGQNRIVGDGVAWLNAEFRVKIWSFKLFRQFFYIGVCPFYDMGMVVQPYRADKHFAFVKEYEPHMTREEYNKLVYTPVHNVGGGISVGWNENFVGLIQIGKTLNQTKRGMEEGLWIDLGVGYAF